jgi:hypothetical protein
MYTGLAAQNEIVLFAVSFWSALLLGFLQSLLGQSLFPEPRIWLIISPLLLAVGIPLSFRIATLGHAIWYFMLMLIYPGYLIGSAFILLVMRSFIRGPL